MSNTIYLFYEKGNEDTAKFITGVKNISDAKRTAERLYKEGCKNISLRPINSDNPIYKMMYKVIYTINNKKRMTTFLGYSDSSYLLYSQIDIAMKELGVKEYSIYPTEYNKFINTMKLIESHNNEPLLHNILRKEYKDEGLSNLFSPKL